MLLRNPEKSQQPSSSVRHVVPVLLAILEVSHMASLLLSEVRTSGFSALIKTIIYYARYDSIAAHFGMLFPFIFIHMALVSTVLFGIALKMLYPKFGGGVMSALCSGIIRYCLYIAFVPVLVSFQTYAWYWCTESQGTYSSSDLLPYPNAIGPLCLLFLPLFVVVLLLGLFFDYSLIYNPSQVYLHARTRSFEYFVHLASRAVVISAYIALASKQLLWIELLFVMSGCVNCYVMATSVPFFSPLTNSLFVWKDVTLAWTTFAVLVGYFVDSDLVTILLFAMISPFFFILVYCDVTRRMSAGMESRRKCDRKFVAMTLAFRGEIRRIVDSETSDETRLQTLFSEMHDCKSDSAVYCLLESSYYLLFLKDTDAARKCFTRFDWSCPSLEERFQRYRIENAEMGNEEEKELKYLQLMVVTQKIKEIDADVCYKLFLLLQEMNSTSCQVQKCERLSTTIAISSKMLLNDTRMALNDFPRSSRLLYLYGSFLEDVLSDTTGRVYKEKAKSLTESSSQKLASIDVIHIFESFLVLCISGLPESLGKVHFMNEKAMQSFEVVKGEVSEMRCEQLLPGGLCECHTDVLEGVILRNLGLGHLVRLYSFLINGMQFCMLTKVQVKLIYWNDSPYFFVSAQPDSERKAVLLFDSDLMVVCHSEGLSLLTGGREITDYRNSYLYDVFPYLPDNIIQFDSGTKVPFCDDSTLVTIFEHCKIGAKMFYSLSILTPERERRLNRKVTVHRSFNHLIRFKDTRIVRFNSEADFISSLNVIEEGDEDSHHDTSHHDSMAEKFLPSESHLKSVPGINSTSALSLVSGSSTVSQQIKLSDKYIVDAARGSKRLKVLLFISIVLIIGIFLGMTVFIVDVIKRLQEVNVIQEMSQRRHLEIDMSNQIRRLQLSESNRDVSSADSLRDRLLSDVANYTSSVNLIKEKIGIWENGKNRDMYFEDITPIFELREGKVFVTKGDMFEVMYNLLYHAGVVANSDSVNSTIESAYYVLRNAPAESFNFVNLSMFLFVEDETTLREKNFVIAEGLFWGVGLTLLFSMICLVAPQVFLLERKHSLIWKAIFDITFEKTVETKHRILDRLQYMHSFEIPEINFVNRPKSEKFRQKFPRIWLTLTLKLSFLVGIGLIFWSVVGFIIYASLKDDLKTMPNYLNWAGLRSTEIYNINYWLKEIQMKYWTSDGYFDIFRLNSYWPSPRAKINDSLISIHFIKKLMGSRNLQYGIYIAQDRDIYKDYRFNNACSQGNPLENCEAGTEVYGLYYALNEYIQHARDISYLIPLGNVTWLQLSQFEVLKENVFETASHGVSVYQSQCRNSIFQHQSDLLVCLVLLSIVLLGTYFGFYAKIVTHVGARLSDRATLLRMISGT